MEVVRSACLIYRFTMIPPSRVALVSSIQVNDRGKAGPAVPYRRSDLVLWPIADHSVCGAMSATGESRQTTVEQSDCFALRNPYSMTSSPPAALAPPPATPLRSRAPQAPAAGCTREEKITMDMRAAHAQSQKYRCGQNSGRSAKKWPFGSSTNIIPQPPPWGCLRTVQRLTARAGRRCRSPRSGAPSHWRHASRRRNQRPGRRPGRRAL